MKKQYLIIVLVVLCITTLAVGYNVFRTNVDVEKKAASVKNFDVVFTKIGVITEVDSENASAVISRDRKNVTISVPNLMVQGAYARFPITIQNVGNIPAKLRSIIQYGMQEDNSISVSYEGIGITDKVLNPGDETEFYVIVKWDNELIKKSNTLRFIISFDYVQAK